MTPDGQNSHLRGHWAYYRPYARLSFGLPALTDGEIEAYAAIEMCGIFGPFS